MQAVLHFISIAIVAGNVYLTARDRAVDDDARGRILLAFAWPAFAVVAGLKDALSPDPRFSILFAVGLVNLGAMIGTWFRPGLVMDMVLPATTVSDPALMRRSRRGQLLGVAAGIAYVAWVFRADIFVD